MVSVFRRKENGTCQIGKSYFRKNVTIDISISFILLKISYDYFKIIIIFVTIITEWKATLQNDAWEKYAMIDVPIMTRCLINI